MKKFRKLFAGLLALCMIFTFMPAVMAEGDTVEYKWQGETVILAPPAGRIAEVPYKLVKKTTTVTVDSETSEETTTVKKEDAKATLTLSGSVPGISLNEEGTAVLVNGNTIKAGTFTVSATAPNGEAEAKTWTVTVQPTRFLLDFEELEADAEASTAYNNWNLETGEGAKFYTQVNGTPKVLEDASGSKYISTAWNAFLRPMTDSFNGMTSARNITVEALCKGTVAMQQTGRTNLVNGDFTLFSANYSDKAFVHVASAFGAWTPVQLNLDFTNREITTWVDGTKISDKTELPRYYKKADDTSDGNLVVYLDNLRLYSGSFDSIAVYSGSPVLPKVGSISGETSLYAPPAGVKSALQYYFADADGNPVSGATWSINGSVKGVSIDNNGKLTLDGSAMTKGSFTISAKTDTVKAEKNISVNNVRFFEDFEDQTEGNDYRLNFTNLDGTTYNSALHQYNATVGKEEDGNLYAAMGSDVKAGIITRWGNTEVANTKNAKVVTVSYKVKSGGSFYAGNSITAGFTNGSFALSGTDTIATIAPLGWSDVRLIFDYTDPNYPKGKLKAYVNEALVAENFALGNLGYFPTDMYFYTSFDDFAVYSGEAVVEDYVTVNGAAYESGTSVLTSENSIVKARLGGLDSENKMFIIASYDKQDKLVKAELFVSSFADVAATLYNVTEGKVKIFLWEDNLTPKEITTIPTEIN